MSCELLVEGLRVLRADADKVDEIRKHGVCLANYERGPISHLIVMLADGIGCGVNDVEWWLYESSEGHRVIYHKDGEEYSLETPEEFVNYYAAVSERVS